MAFATVTARKGNSDPAPLAHESTEYFWQALGTREQLIQEGLCTASQFPAGRKRTALDHDRQGHMWALKAKRGGLWELKVWRTRDEIDACRRGAATRAEAEKELAWMPQTHQQYRERAVGSLDDCLNSFRKFNVLPTEWNGYSFDEETREAFDEVAAELISILRDGGTVFNAQRHNARVSKLRTGAARGDTGLQDFLARAVASATPRARNPRGKARVELTEAGKDENRSK